MKKTINPEQLDRILTRGVENVYPSKEALKEYLLSGKKLKIYIGIDPTGPFLHLGHAIPIRKMMQLRELGHEVILLMGDFTGKIGDPTDKTATRVQLTEKQVLKNCKGYKDQLKNIVDFKSKKNPVKLKFNSAWLGKLKFDDVVNLAANFTVQQMLERSMFHERMENNKPIGLHEFLYPLMQGYDSVAMDVNMEIGGNDQTFNMLAGRNLLRSLKNKEKFVLTTRLLVDPSGKKMGKTEGNMITLVDSPNDMFGKVMSWSDELIASGFEICTDVSDEDVERIKKDLSVGVVNPRDLKMKLAEEIVKIYYGEKKAILAEENFVHTFSKREVPEEMMEAKARTGEMLVDILFNNKVVGSKSEFRRLLDGRAIDCDGQVLNDPHFKIERTSVVKIGKKKFLKIIVR